LWQKWSNTNNRQNTLLVIEDAAQSHGFEDEDQNVVKRRCSLTVLPWKNLGALGDGGAIVTE
jgi:dTDP-4-amino-4,6-dideoxygalactose transaminase